MSVFFSFFFFLLFSFFLSYSISFYSILYQVKLVNLVHHMGGTIRKDFSAKVTHLIAHSTHGEKYRVCISIDLHMLLD